MPSAASAPSPCKGLSIADQSLAAQEALLPQALGVFGVCLPIYVWAGSYAQNSAWMSATFAIFAINWGLFYFVVQWLRRPEARETAGRTRVHVLCGLLWSGAVWQMAAFADHAGPARDTLLMMTVAAAVACLFFTTPLLPALLIVGPLAMAGPLAFLLSSSESSGLARMAWGAFAFASMLSLILNQNLRRQFALAAERSTLAAELAASLEEAERLARSKSALVATLSHEIRNGLTGVAHVLASAVGQGGRAAPSRDQLGAALNAANDLISVLNATLDTETAEAGRLSVDNVPLDAAPMVRELAALIRPEAAAKGLEVQVFVEPQLEARESGAAVADPTRVRQVLANLFGNAVKYTLRGRIEARVERRGADRLAIAIADTGPGLSLEELAEAFEPFHRVTRTGAGVPGAGLGLSLSRQLAKLMGAELTARSALGVGSCFTLELAYDENARAEISAAVDESAVVQAAGLRVLMAEDDGLNAAMLRTILEQLGHQVVHAQNGRRAVELAKSLGFDLIMVDGRMPVMDGREAILAIRRLPGPAAEAPIVAVIGGEAHEASQCLEAGADSVMRKPANVASVARALAEATAARRPKAA
ncbi:MAG: response regulator [Caulobacteraceae bacterium]|nr:response regulator [Caulobacteraceae bacterium]